MLVPVTMVRVVSVLVAGLMGDADALMARAAMKRGRWKVNMMEKLRIGEFGK